jgi:glucans biosynthesis protein C
MNTTSTRRLDLDWMRIIAILIVFFYHSCRFFNLDAWHVKNAVTYSLLNVSEHFLDKWMMPFVFVVSGASLFYALGKGKGWGAAGAFVKDKFLRLFVPLVVNVFSLCILQVYLERYSHHEFSGSLIDFLPHYFEGIYGINGNFALVGMHLWYLAVLFVFSLVLLPVFLLLKSRIGSRALGGLTAAIALPGGVYLLAFILGLSWKLISPDSILGFDKFNWNLGVYLTYFVFGFVMVSSEKLQRSIVTLRWVSLVLAVAISIYYFNTDEFDEWVSWSCVLAFLGFGMKYLNVHKPALKYASEAVLPFYILHQTVLLCVGYFIVQWALPDLLKWAAIVVTSLAIILGSYEYLIRRSNVLRFLFGMKLMKKAVQVAPALAQPVPGKI